MLVTHFNDRDADQARSLETAITGLLDVDKLRHKPVVDNTEVGTDMVKRFQEMKFIPTLFFVDPWGYKGLSLDLVNSVLKDWGCDCVFFFNYNRINMGLSNPLVREHMDCLFGPTRAEQLRVRLESIEPRERQLMIIEELCDALGASAGRFVLPFCFKDHRGTRTSHHLIFVSKNFRGYEIMKAIMAKESSMDEQGVPTFEYNPADERFPLLFELNRPLDDLEGMLLSEYSGTALTMLQVYEKHNVGRRYVKPNYKEALTKLETEGRIKCDPPAEERRKGTFADRVRVTFPRKGGK